MLEDLKNKVLEGNLRLPGSGLVTLTWGNASAIERKDGYVVIKPSGLSYTKMGAEDMTVTDLNGKKVEGRWKPSSDLATHLEIYRSFPEIGGIVHTHSRWATVFAQCGWGIPALGTTHADTFYGEIPCTRPLRREEIFGDYEKETGKVILETFRERAVMSIPGVLVHSHGPFTWGENIEKAVENAIILEEVAMMAWHTLMADRDVRLEQAIMDRHYFRKHGDHAYYGQEC